MNSSLQKALMASMLVVGGSVAALGQGFNYDPNCWDPNNTAPYSTDFISYYLETPLWQAGLGVSGTVAYKYCVPGSSGGGSVPVSGRFQFGPGPQGSIQDNLRIAAGEYDVSPDDYEDFQWGTNHGIDKFGTGATSGSGWSFARIQIQGSSDVLFGGNAFEIAYIGASNRYMTATQVSGSTSITLQVDVVGDAARFEWLIVNNTGKAVGYGLELGQWVYPVGGYSGLLLTGSATPVDNYDEYLGYANSNGILQPYITVPGLKPRETQEAFGVQGEDPVPAYVDFSGGEYTVDSKFNIVQTISPQLSGGMQVVNLPFQDVEDELGNSDQTPVDEFDLGDVAHLLDGNGLVTDPVFNNVLFNDVNLGSDASFAQKWYYASTPNGQARTIVSYYRSIWGDSNYFGGYVGVVDTPKSLAADLSVPGYGLNPNPFTIEVDIDNTGVFGNEYQEVNMDSVEVDLTLPPGMYPANGSPTQTTIKKFISSGIQARSIGVVDFNVAASPTVFGPQPYTVTIIPNPGTSKTIKGTINVAATPLIHLAAGANLISEPWYNGTQWSTVLDNLTAVRSFEAYNWDPVLQEYTVSSGSQRSIGTWIVINNPPSGFFPLGGSPQQPKDEFPPSTGASNLPLQEGWNLIGNPYNYSFPLGQLVGAPSTGGAFTYDQLVSNGVLDGSFAYYDPDLQTYDFLGADTDELLPNHGYWVYCSQPMTLVFPPVYDLFDRSVTPTFQQYANHWRLQMAVQGVGAKDLNNYFEVNTVSGQAGKDVHRKPPISEATKAVRAFLTASTTNYNGSSNKVIGTGVKGSRGASTPEYAQMAVSTPGKHSFNMSVYANQTGPVTVTWPNLSTLPKNLQVTVKDLETGHETDARLSAGYTFAGTANRTRTLQVTITPESTVRQSITNVTTQIIRRGGTKTMNIGFVTATGGIATVAIYQNSKQVASVETNQVINAGTNAATWGLTLSTGKVAKPGTYTMVITAVGDGGDTAIKYVTLNL